MVKISSMIHKFSKLFYLMIIRNNIMLINQKPGYRQPSTNHSKGSQTKDSRNGLRKREIIEKLSAERVKLTQTKSDNYEEPQILSIKKMKSLHIIPKNIEFDQSPLNEYQLATPQKQKRKDLPFDMKSKEGDQQKSSSNNTGQIFSQYQKSKSRYKNAKEKARKLIQNMINNSKQNAEEVSNQLKNKIDEIKTQVPVQNILFDDFQTTKKTSKKQSTLVNAPQMRPKFQKCTTLKIGDSQLSPIRIKITSPSSSKEELSPFKCSIIVNSASKLRGSSNSIQQSEQSQRKTQSSKKSIVTADSGTKNTNPLVFLQKNMFSEYGINDFNIKGNQKEIIQETQKAVKQVSRQITMSRKQNQKLITRARQKNKKIVGKLKEMRQKRSSMRNSYFIKNDLMNLLPKPSRLNEQFSKLNPKSSIFKQNLDPLHLSFNFQESTCNFLCVNSKNVPCSEISNNEQIREKIFIHLQTIKMIADYAESFSDIYQDCSQWGDLIFLLYKKYYIERFKIYHVLKAGEAKLKNGTIYKQTPFAFNFCEVSIQQIQAFRQSKEQISLELDLQRQNREIKSTLREFYNRFIEKTADNPLMNMLEVDDFNQQILEGLNEEINMLKQSGAKSLKVKKRINQAIQVGLIIQHIEGYTFQEIQEIVVGQLETKEYFENFYKKFMQIFQDDKKT